MPISFYLLKDIDFITQIMFIEQNNKDFQNTIKDQLSVIN